MYPEAAEQTMMKPPGNRASQSSGICKLGAVQTRCDQRCIYVTVEL